MNEPLRILLVGAHPADVFDNAGGTLCHHVQDGDQVTLLALTQGSRVHDVVISQEMSQRQKLPDAEELRALMAERVEVKRRELREACAILDLTDVRFLEYDDAVLILNERMVLEVAKIIREVRPHLIISQWPEERGGLDQHAVTGQITLMAMGAAGSVYPGDPNPPHHVTQVFFMATSTCLMRRDIWGSQGGFYADVVVDISDVIERKLRALDHLRSQGYNGLYARKRIESADGTTGFFASGGSAAYAEAFMRMNGETHRRLPVTERALAWTALAEGERFKRYCHLVAHTIPEEGA